MAPVLDSSATPLLARAVDSLGRRSLTLTGASKVTVGVIVAYVVIIALLWNIPYVRNVLWPFKVWDLLNHLVQPADIKCRCSR